MAVYRCQWIVAAEFEAGSQQDAQAMFDRFGEGILTGDNSGMIEAGIHPLRTGARTFIFEVDGAHIPSQSDSAQNGQGGQRRETGRRAPSIFTFHGAIDPPDPEQAQEETGS